MEDEDLTFMEEVEFVLWGICALIIQFFKRTNG